MKPLTLFTLLFFLRSGAYADNSWMPGSYAPPDSPLATKYFVPEIRLDSAYHYSFANPKDNTISGSSEVFRHQELQLTQVGIGGDVTVDRVGFRLMTQFGLYSQTTPRNDPSVERGQWRLADAYRYISEAYGTYHIDYDGGINIQAGIFMSYVGLWSYYNFDNWTYQPSFVSSNTPWFFEGVRVQYFPNDKIKIEPWLINGWQSYGMYNHSPGLGLQLTWKPVDWLAFVGNQYYGADTLNSPDRKRIHTDESLMLRYYNKGGKGLSRAAASLTIDLGCETGGGTNCEKSNFRGFMAYQRIWFNDSRYGLTFGGGMINNPGRYLVLVPPINGATAYSGAPTWFTANPGDPFRAWDMQVSGDYSPSRNLTFRLEYNHRWASVPYFSGPEGLTPPGGNSGSPGSDPGGGWRPDLVQNEDRLTAAMLIRL